MNDIQNRITALKKEKNAVILAHYYVNMDAQAVADHVGDSFALAKTASELKADIIVMCGVRFMAESAKILSPEKKVLLPVAKAGCPMADTVTPEDVKRLRRLYPEAAVVCYVNSSADVKAVSDICCTSSSAVRIVRSLPQRQIVFIPDRNLGSWVQTQAPEKEIILYSGCCPVHNNVTVEDVKAARAAHPGAKLLTHPECPPEVVKMSDVVGSTAAILDTVIRGGPKDSFIIATEQGLADRIKALYPEKRIWQITGHFLCEDMKKITLKDVLRSLETGETEIRMTDGQIAASLNSLDRMVKS